MDTAAAVRLVNAERVLLYALAFVLPIMEGPKNLFVALLFGLWLIRIAGYERPALRRPDLVELALLWILLACGVSTLINWPLINGLKGLKDTLFYLFVFWIVYRAPLTDERRHTLLLLSSLGVLVGLVWGSVEVFTGRRPNLEFHSAGVVTQSSIYLGMVLFAAVGTAFFGPHVSTPPHSERRLRIYWWAASALMAIGLFLMASRGAILAVLFAYLLLNVLVNRRKLWLTTALLVSLGVGAMVLIPNVFQQARFVDKTSSILATGDIDASDAVRIDMWRIALARAARGDAILFGIGPRNFPSIDVVQLQLDLPPSVIAGKLNHAHNLFLEKLVEEGIFGLGALVFLFAVTARRLYRDWRGDRWRNWPWIAALGALVVPVVAGSFNTPWHQEHAMLAMMLLAVYLSRRQTAA